MDELKKTRPAIIEGQFEYGLFILSGDIDKELDKLGIEGWQAFGFIPQQPNATGAQDVLVPCIRPRRVITMAREKGVGLLR